MQRPWTPSPLRPPSPSPCLTFAPLAWLKLQYFCHAGPTEVGGFGIAAADLLHVEDFVTVRQQGTPVSVHFADEAVADFFDACVDRGLPPERFARLWCHTHPGASVTPSATDEDTFARNFGRCAWAVMFILGRTGRTYARLAFAAGPGGHLVVPTAVNWSAWPGALARAGSLPAQVEQWRQEYATNVHSLPQAVPLLPAAPEASANEVHWWDEEPWREDLDGIFYEPTPKGDAHEPPF